MKSERSRRGSWEGWLGKTATPIFVLGSDRSIQMFNTGCELLTGWQAKEVVGQVCNFRSDASHNSLEGMTAGLSPPAEVFAGSELEVPTYLECRGGPPIAKVIRFTPIKDAKGKVTGVVGIISAIEPPAPAEIKSPILRLHAELATVRNRLRKRFGEQTLVGQSRLMQRVVNQVGLAQKTSASLYLQGEPGTGKEHLARVIHFGGMQQRHWFVPLDCKRMSSAEMTSILERLVEVHRRGSSSESRPQPGTVYLADVEELPRDLQEMIVRDLLREPGKEEFDAGLRLIAAGEGPLKEGVANEKLRIDLAAALGTLTIELPPLRERGEDLPLLSQHFLEQQNKTGNKQQTGFAEGVMEEFLRYNWPGNLDELQEVIQAACDQGDGQIKPGDLPFRFRAGREAQDYPPPMPPEPMPLDSTLEGIEKELIVAALERNGFNKTKAAEMLQVNRARLYRRMEQLGIEDREGNG